MAEPVPHSTLIKRLRAGAAKKKEQGSYREAKAMEDEATRIEQGEGFKLLAQKSPGENAVIRRLHQREAAGKRRGTGTGTGTGTGVVNGAGVAIALTSVFLAARKLSK